MHPGREKLRRRNANSYELIACGSLIRHRLPVPCVYNGPSSAEYDHAHVADLRTDKGRNRPKNRGDISFLGAACDECGKHHKQDHKDKHPDIRAKPETSPAKAHSIATVPIPGLSLVGQQDRDLLPKR
jgi:hypothetical protein